MTYSKHLCGSVPWVVRLWSIELLQDTGAGAHLGFRVANMLIWGFLALQFRLTICSIPFRVKHNLGGAHAHKLTAFLNS